jgi:hypothetical protein
VRTPLEAAPRDSADGKVSLWRHHWQSGYKVCEHRATEHRCFTWSECERLATILRRSDGRIMRLGDSIGRGQRW